jgi:DNA invertase Pin-like site-specific DNA recombinase/ssDNA-binding Zn-finger/Zn-ribbon topoisomerase 1
MKNHDKKIVAYIRVSTSEQANENFSLQDQEESIKNWASQNNAKIVKTYRDEGKSAFTGKRLGFSKMLEDIQVGAIRADYVIAYNQSRLSRNEKNRLEAMYILQRAGMKFISILEPTPEDEDQAFLLQNMTGTFAELQSRNQGKMSAIKLNNYAQKGFHTGGIPPFGYKSVDLMDPFEKRMRKVLATNEDEANLVRLIFDLAKNGKSGNRYGVKRISSYLNDHSIKRRGRRWNLNDVHRILTNTIYFGERHYGKNRIRIDLKHEIVVQKVPAIIDNDLFNDVQKLLKNNAPEMNNHQALVSPALLTGLLKCSECGGNLVINTGKGGRYKYYKCRTRIKCSTESCSMRQIPKAKLEEEIIRELRDKVITNKSVTSMLGDIKTVVKSKYDDMNNELFILNSKKSKIEQQYQRLLVHIANGEIQPGEYVKKNMSEYESELESLMRQIHDLKDTLRLPLRRFGERQTQKFIRAARRVLLNPENEACKSLLNALVSKIVVKKSDVNLQGSKFKMMGVISGYESGHSEFRVPTHISIWR